MSLRHSLLARLLAGSILVAVCSITATAWLTARNTSGAIEREQGQTLASDAQIYDTLLGYAATHPRWDGVAETVKALAAKTGRRIALTTEDGAPIADSAPGSRLPRPAADVDPLRVDLALKPSVSGERIDPRAVAPYGVPEAELARLLKAARSLVSCLSKIGQETEIGFGLSGRPFLKSADGYSVPPQPWAPLQPQQVAPEVVKPTAIPGPPGCIAPDEATATLPQEKKALKELNTATNRCLAGQRIAKISVSLDGTWYPVGKTSATDRPAIRACLASSRQAQLKPHVSAPAVLFLADPGTPARSVTADVGGVATVAAAVLLLTVGISVLLATRLIRPVHALTGAAQRMRDGDPTARVQVKDRGELGRLAAAFNEMSEHLEQLERQRKDLISDISHELRTPLSVLRGWMEAAQDGVAELDPPLLAALIEELLTLQRIVGDLQELALADAGALRLHPEPIDLADFLPGLAATHKGQAETAGLTLSTEVSPACLLDADPSRLRQILANLLTNAIRHTPPGGHVSLNAHRRTNLIIIEVRDNGTGIPADELPHVFDRFWRSDKSRTRRTGGSGLGLAIARTLVEAHQGTITVSSEQAKGTTFTLTLPSR